MRSTYFRSRSARPHARWFPIRAGILTTIAGTDWLFPADGLPAIDAPLNSGFGFDVVTDPNGNFYIADEGNEMAMRVDPTASSMSSQATVSFLKAAMEASQSMPASSLH